MTEFEEIIQSLVKLEEERLTATQSFIAQILIFMENYEKQTGKILTSKEYLEICKRIKK